MNSCLDITLRSSSKTDALESAKELLITLKKTDEKQLEFLLSQKEELKAELKAIDPLLIGESRYNQQNKVYKFACHIKFSTRYFFAQKMGKIQPRLAKLSDVERHIIELRSAHSQKISQIEKISSEILNLEKEQKAIEHTKLQAAKEKLSYENLTLARRTALKEASSSRPRSISRLDPLITPQEPDRQTQQIKIQASPLLTALSPLASVQTPFEKFKQALGTDLKQWGIPESFLSILLDSIFPEVSTFSKPSLRSFELCFDQAYKFEGSLSGLNATLQTPLKLKIELDDRKKSIKFDKEAIRAITNYGIGYLAALDFQKKELVTLDCLLKKGFYIPFSTCYSYKEFEKDFGSLSWKSC